MNPRLPVPAYFRLGLPSGTISLASPDPLLDVYHCLDKQIRVFSHPVLQNGINVGIGMAKIDVLGFSGPKARVYVVMYDVHLQGFLTMRSSSSGNKFEGDNVMSRRCTSGGRLEPRHIECLSGLTPRYTVNNSDPSHELGLRRSGRCRYSEMYKRDEAEWVSDAVARHRYDV